MARGDHIFVHRLGGAYAHHGIDCGDGSVIHFGAERWYSLRIVERTELENFTRGGTVEVRDYRAFLERLHKPTELPRRLQLALERNINTLLGRDSIGNEFAPDAVVMRAESRLGDRRFNLLFHNCEHFATWCKTGLTDSEQVNALWRLALGASDFRRLRREGMRTRLFERDWWHGKPPHPSDDP